MAGSSFALDSLDRNDLALDLLDTDGLFGAQLDCEPLGVSELDMANVNDMASLHSTGLSERLGLEEEEAVSQLGWPSPVTEGHGLDSLECGDISLAELDHHLSDAAAFQEPLEEDFQKMLSEWETHIGSLATGGEDEAGGGGREENSGQCRPHPQPSFRLAPSNTPPRTSPLLSPTTRQLPVSSSGLRSPVLPRPGVSYTRVAGLGMPRVSSKANPTYLPVAALSPLRSPPASPQYSQQRPPPATSSLLDTIKFSNCSSDLSTTLENQKRRMEWLESNFQRGGSASSTSSNNHHHQSNSKIIAAVSPGKDGHATTRILSSRSLKDTLPRELIEKIKAASQGRKTIAIIEPVNKDRNCSRRPWQPPASGGGRWRHVGVVSPLQSHNISDHDYCSPGRKPSKMVKTEVENLQQSLNQTSMEVTSPRETRGRDSGLESAEMSDASEDGLYDKLPPYLTSVSVQTMTNASEQDHGYTRLPAYIGASVRPQQQSVLKSSVLRVHSGEEAPMREEMSLRVPREEGISMRGRGRVIVRREHSSGSSSGEEGGRSESSGRRQRRRSRSPRSRRRSQSRERRSSSRSVSSSGSRRRRTHAGRTGWRSSRGGGEGRPEHRAGEGRLPYDRERERREQERRQRQQDTKRQVEERRVVYVGGIQEGTLKDDLRRRFQVFGPILDISVHFRDHGDNYGFVTFQYKVDAYAAVERGNDDSSQPAYDLCFGGRRAFCKEKYLDLDDMDDGGAGEQLGFDALLERARSCGLVETTGNS